MDSATEAWTIAEAELEAAALGTSALMDGIPIMTWVVPAATNSFVLSTCFSALIAWGSRASSAWDWVFQSLALFFIWSLVMPSKTFLMAGSIFSTA